MIGGALRRFHPDNYYTAKQRGAGFGSAWKDIKTRAPRILGDILTETAMAGVKGLNSRGKGKKPNWKGALEGIKTGVARSVKRKAQQELSRLVVKKVRKDLFGR